MTREEAIEDLKYLISGECTDSAMDYVEAIEMAIDALSSRRKMPLKSPILKYNSFKCLEYCVCGTNHKAYLYYNQKDHKWYMKCPKCDLKAESATVPSIARRHWNDMIIEMKQKAEEEEISK